MTPQKNTRGQNLLYQYTLDCRIAGRELDRLEWCRKRWPKLGYKNASKTLSALNKIIQSRKDAAKRKTKCTTS